MIRLQLNDYVLPEQSFHIFRITHGPENPLGLHTHADFGEVFFVEQGEGYHVVNGSRIPLRPGTIAFVRPEDEHTVIGKDKRTSITIINTAFRSETLEYFRERYFPGMQKFFFTRESIPYHITVDQMRLDRLVKWAETVFNLPWINQTLDPFLLKICSLEDHESYAYYPEGIPFWLLNALEQFRDPEYFNSGIKGFVKLAGRSQEHVHRVLKKFLNQSLSETVNKARIQYAARQLSLTDQKIIAISMECSFHSLGYFYKCFKKHFGLSPDQYRRKNRSLL